MALPNLIIPGAPKAGTSSLHKYLSLHDAVYMSEPKELHFFSVDEQFEKGVAQYAVNFEGVREEKVIGESSTTYFIFPNVVERIACTLDSPKLIFILRNPIDRVYSHYRWMQSLGLENRSFIDALLADKDDSPDINTRISGNKTKYYFAESCYGTHVGKFVKQFGMSRVLIQTTEQLGEFPSRVLENCAQFLGIDSFEKIDPVWENATRSDNTQPISDGDHRWLTEHLFDEVESLRQLTGLQFTEWENDFPISN